MNFINKTQREGTGGTGTGTLPPGMSRVNNQLPEDQGCCTGEWVTQGKRSLLRRFCLRARDPSPHSLEIGPCLLCLKPFRGCRWPQHHSQIFSILLDQGVLMPAHSLSSLHYCCPPPTTPGLFSPSSKLYFSTNCSLSSSLLLCLLKSLSP